MLRRLYNWFKSLFYRKKAQKEENKKTYHYRYEFVDDVPDIVKPGVIYLVQNQGYCWQSAMDCPCGCKSILFMNHVEDFDPSWKYKINEKNLISLYPSVDRTVGCKSHFWITEGRVVWCN